MLALKSKEQRKFSVTTQQLSNSSLTESATKGMAERIFRETKEHNLRFIERIDSIDKQEQVIGFIEGYITRLRSMNMSKKAALKNLRDVFCCGFKISLYSVYLTGKVTKSIHGTFIHDERLYLVLLHINNKRPHASKMEKQCIGFSKHAIARILLRYKPYRLENNLLNLGIILEDTINALDHTKGMADGDKKWVYLPELGGFLLAKEANSYVLITVINETLMANQQKEEAIKNLKEIEAKDTVLLGCIESESKWLRECKELDHFEISNLSVY